MNVLLVIVAVLLGLVGLVFVMRAYFRFQQRAQLTELREAIRAYVEGRGATVVFDDDGMHVKGPLGEGRERLTALRIMCSPDKRSSWETSISFTLRRYIPDAFHEAFAKAARERLAKALPEMDALGPDELRARLRIRVRMKRSSAEGLATCASPVGEDFEARVVVDGFDVDGLPTSVRARFEESDGALREQALSATLGDAPPAASGEAAHQAWLCRPESIFGSDPFLIACDGAGLAWIPARPGTPEEVLAKLASRSLSTGAMKGRLFAWDGVTLHDVPNLVHTIIGPTTPDFTLRLPPALIEAFAVVSPDGTIGVRRGPR